MGVSPKNAKKKGDYSEVVRMGKTYIVYQQKKMTDWTMASILEEHKVIYVTSIEELIEKVKEINNKKK
ncbi:hypothetical protein [Aureibacter tunicatorum]|uniref:Uncharacterized protein n=1 Tax=Aureibacter tunicatorum TaxID=866807 RepID=A0AAE4BRK1_9BACT|nr:hypothetical protein [Aureibacter tunicatorum]MDR6237895.1 hypothetical protein [Aureibacter tunicatorum]BDD02928.1 hypothetical protein AUTU_04110 [Aureibacter tunicatorum]